MAQSAVPEKSYAARSPFEPKSAFETITTEPFLGGTLCEEKPAALARIAPPLEQKPEFSFWRSLVAGAAAGTTVDLALFPLDTVKTRLQSSEGFWKSGGFKGIYRGLLPVIIGSAPSAALFFGAYDTSKHRLTRSWDRPAYCHMAAACIGEVVACLIRVPTETVKQRMQAGLYPSFRSAVLSVAQKEGVGTLYSGYSVTVAREIPFALIQFPLWEQLKARFAFDERGRKNDITASICGSVSGALAAAVTTPLDVAKTRIMLGKDKHGVAYTSGVYGTLARIWKDEGGGALFRGVVPRVKMIAIGGLIFFGAYEHTNSYLIRTGML